MGDLDQSSSSSSSSSDYEENDLSSGIKNRSNSVSLNNYIPKPEPVKIMPKQDIIELESSSDSDDDIDFDSNNRHQSSTTANEALKQARAARELLCQVQYDNELNTSANCFDDLETSIEINESDNEDEEEDPAILLMTRINGNEKVRKRSWYLKSRDSFQKLIDALVKELNSTHGVVHDDVWLHFDGEKLLTTDTPTMKGMENNDLIDVTIRGYDPAVCKTITSAPVLLKKIKLQLRTVSSSSCVPYWLGPKEPF